MTDATRFRFTNPSVPKAYDEFFVPRLFEPWAKLLLDEVQLRPGDHVLDVATGQGTVARLVHSGLAPAVGSARQTSPSQCWILRGASLI
jgi:ubiquinone/menaquinone biosynthesis C-methylase UbiE